MSGQPVIFVGPSLEHTAIAQRLPRARLEPPVARGDLDRMRTEGHTAFLIIDGAFAHTLAITSHTGYQTYGSRRGRRDMRIS